MRNKKKTWHQIVTASVRNIDNPRKRFLNKTLKNHVLGSPQRCNLKDLVSSSFWLKKSLCFVFFVFSYHFFNILFLVFFVLKSKFLNQYKSFFPKKQRIQQKQPKSPTNKSRPEFFCTQDPTGQTRVLTCGWCTTRFQCAFLGLLRAAWGRGGRRGFLSQRKGEIQDNTELPNQVLSRWPL